MKNYTEIVILDYYDNWIGSYDETEEFNDYTDKEIIEELTQKYGNEICICREWYINGISQKTDEIYNGF